MVKFSKPGADDPWYNVRLCTHLPGHLLCILLIIACMLSLYACVYKYACEQGCAIIIVYSTILRSNAQVCTYIM